jgi:glutamyl-tRNA reductase
VNGIDLKKAGFAAANAGLETLRLLNVLMSKVMKEGASVIKNTKVNTLLISVISVAVYVIGAALLWV